MKQSTVKGLVHLGLALLGAVELPAAKSAPRKLLLGAMVGFHVYATLYHFREEESVTETR